MATQKFDELNIIPIEQYFNEMELTDKQKKERIELAEEFEDMFFWFIYLYDSFSKDEEGIRKAINDSDLSIVSDMLYERYVGVLNKKGIVVDNELDTYISSVTKTIPKTLNNKVMKNETSDGLNAENGTKINISDMVVNWSENETNTVSNHDDYTTALAQGKTNKTWVTMKDNKVRISHELVDEEIVPIDEYFMVGTSKMRYPRDINGSADEIIGCRCSVVYS